MIEHIEQEASCLCLFQESKILRELEQLMIELQENEVVNEYLN
ncbi:unnamed protein product [marine sediment metagenome]|uniref:Uncharacterized protein n=1 Tax=marine sediment metagenome TaxID=412755 RepID=X1UNQ2_9ZZZZ